jgi:D-3-phosphoglycerate dehydrogenase
LTNVKVLEVIGRGGVGMDNIAVDYALSKGIKVINTPDASARAVAELSFAHFYLVQDFSMMPTEICP